LVDRHRSGNARQMLYTRVVCALFLAEKNYIIRVVWIRKSNYAHETSKS